MKTKEFLSENREEVINYFNNEVKNFWNISLKDFMIDLLSNFRKVTISEGLKRMDLTANLKEAKSRLGCFDNETKVSYSKPYSESNHAKAVAYFGKEKVQLMSNAK